MAWCPKCKMEYRDDIMQCADCKVALVQALSVEKVSCIQGNREMIEDIFEFISNYEDITTAEIAEIDSQQFKLLVSEDEVDLMIDTIKMYLKECDQEIEEDSNQKKPKPVSNVVYETKEFKAKENMSSSIILIILGVLGIIFLILSKLNIISFYMNSIFFLVILIMFLICIGAGIIMMLQSQKLYDGIESENTLVASVKSWVRENCSQPQIDELLQCAEDSDEIKYFKRTQYVKQQIHEQFLNLEEVFVDHYVDELYEELFNN